MLLLTTAILTTVVIADLALPGGAGFVMPAILGATAASSAAAALVMHRKVPA